MRMFLAIAVLLTFGCSSEENDPVTGVAGLHVLSNFAEEHVLVSTLPTDDEITSTVESLDWERGFFSGGAGLAIRAIYGGRWVPGSNAWIEFSVPRSRCWRLPCDEGPAFERP